MSPDIKELSVYDSDLDLFESQYTVPEGISYNSYLITDNRTALLDTVDKRKATEWQENLLRELGDKELDYLIVQHLEPDHTSQIEWVMTASPNASW
ncbi:MAG: hypothetical protein K2M98_06560 [Muribaculum sp.]|nr:hypothetical protein [Muribaculum sp.]